MLRAKLSRECDRLTNISKLITSENIKKGKSLSNHSMPGSKKHLREGTTWKASLTPYLRSLSAYRGEESRRHESQREPCNSHPLPAAWENVPRSLALLNVTYMFTPEDVKLIAHPPQAGLGL